MTTKIMIYFRDGYSVKVRFEILVTKLISSHRVTNPEFAVEVGTAD